MSDKIEDAQILCSSAMETALVDLVEALNGTYWSSWQTTASFRKQLDSAEEAISARKKGRSDE